MLDPSLKPIGFDTWEKESWPKYQNRLQLSQDRAVQQFFRQVVYDHFDHFNSRYPTFKLSNYRISIELFSATQALAEIRFFGDTEMTMWCWQYDEFEKKSQNYPIYQEMSRTGSAPFPPVLISSERLICDLYTYGKPLHLIEGTHRVSYLRRMLDRRLILPESVHEFVVLRPAG